MYQDASLSGKGLTLWMLGNFLKIDYIVVCFLKPLNSACFLMGLMNWVANRLDLRPASWVTWRLAWIQPVWISINAVPALKGLSICITVQTFTLEQLWKMNKGISSIYYLQVHMKNYITSIRTLIIITNLSMPHNNIWDFFQVNKNRYTSSIWLLKDSFSSYVQGLTLSLRGNKHYAYANRLDRGKPPSNSAAGLRSNLFVTQTIISHKGKHILLVLNSRWHFNLSLQSYPAVNALTEIVYF